MQTTIIVLHQINANCYDEANMPAPDGPFEANMPTPDGPFSHKAEPRTPHNQIIGYEENIVGSKLDETDYPSNLCLFIQVIFW